MLCAKLISNKGTCAPVSGGIAQIFLFDPADFDFTQGAAVAGVVQPYTAIVDLSEGDPNFVYPVNFQRYEAEYTAKQSSKAGFYTKYEHQISCVSPDLSMLQTQWNMLVDKAGACCGVGVIIVLNSGKIFIMGESSVNAAALAVPFFTYQDGSTATSGKKFDDANATTVMIKGDYSRPLIQYTGGISTILALVEAA